MLPNSLPKYVPAPSFLNSQHSVYLFTVACAHMCVGVRGRIVNSYRVMCVCDILALKYLCLFT